MIKVSIIIPCYNAEKYLKRCLDSLVNQTLKDIEIICINDGSTDNTLDILNKYAKQDKRIKVITQENSGQAVARNQGLKKATGKYLMFCDSDDWYEPNMSQVMYETIQEKNVDIVSCHNFFDFENNIDENEKKLRSNFNYYNKNITGYRLFDKKTVLSTNIVLWNKIIRNDLVKKYKMSFPKIREYEDNLFVYMYCMVAKDIFYLKLPLYHYFLRNNSCVSNWIKKKLDNRFSRVIICQNLIDFVIKNQLHDKATIVPAICVQELKSAQSVLNDEEIVMSIRKLNSDIKKLDIPYYLFYHNGNIYESVIKSGIINFMKYLYYSVKLFLLQKIIKSNQGKIDKYVVKKIIFKPKYKKYSKEEN